MSTEIVVHQPDLRDDVEYAKLVSVGSMLPAQYRGKPADIMIAIGLGRAMGLSPAESLYRINVIQGRPSASAELIAANVRKAGHILRVRGDERSARATIVRADDPGFEFESMWDMDRARRLGLADKDGWKKQPATMMRWRAITEVARLACPEALYGVAYVREEIEDDGQFVAAPQRVSAADFMQPAASEGDPGEVVEAEVVEQPETGEAITDGQRRAMFAAFAAAGFTTDARSADGKAARLEYIGRVVGAEVASTNDLTKAQAAQVLDALAADAAEQTGTAVESDELDASWVAGEGR